MADRYDSLAPKDVIITFRSLRRRFDTVGGVVRADPELLARADEPGPEGASFGRLLARAAEELQVTADGIVDLATHLEPTIDPAAVDPAASTGGDRLAIEEATAVVGDAADRVADVLDAQEADGWSRTARVSDGRSIDLITLSRSAVRRAIESLRAAERQMEWLRSS